MKTKFTELFNIEKPIIQGAMAWVSDAELTAAVSNAGGAGIIATAGRNPDWIRAEIRKAKELTDKPFGINLVMQEKDVEDKKRVILEEKVDFVTIGAGNPIPHIEDFHKVGIKVIAVVPSLKLAKRVEKAGVDALVIEGMEAGGHIGKLTTMALMTQVIPEIEIPVIAAGGISDYRGAAAAFLMGASAIQMGTRFYASKECTAHINSKNAIVNAVDVDTITTGTGAHRVRGIRNKMTDTYWQLVENNASKEELTNLVKGTSRLAPEKGDIDNGFVQAGQSLSVITSIDSCKEIIDSIMDGAEKLLNMK